MCTICKKKYIYVKNKNGKNIRYFWINGTQCYWHTAMYTDSSNIFV